MNSEPAPTESTPAVEPALRLVFERGVSPSKWATRWAEQHPGLPLAIEVRMARRGDPLAAGNCDVLLARVGPNGNPAEHSAEPLHTLRLYEEAVSVMLPEEHDLAERESIDATELAELMLLPHPEHADAWPAPTPWADQATAPTSLAGTLEVVLAGVGAALVSDPLARHLGKKGLRRVPVTGLPGTWIWACWLVEADGPIIQDFVGVLRGRTRSSSRHASEPTPEGKPAKKPKPKPQPKATKKHPPRGKRVRRPRRS